MNSEAWLNNFVQADTELTIGRCHRHVAPPSWHFLPRITNDHILYYVISGRIAADIGEERSTGRRDKSLGRTRYSSGTQ